MALGRLEICFEFADGDYTNIMIGFFRTQICDWEKTMEHEIDRENRDWEQADREIRDWEKTIEYEIDHENRDWEQATQECWREVLVSKI